LLSFPSINQCPAAATAAATAGRGASAIEAMHNYYDADTY